MTDIANVFIRCAYFQKHSSQELELFTFCQTSVGTGLRMVSYIYMPEMHFMQVMYIISNKIVADVAMLK